LPANLLRHFSNALICAWHYLARQRFWAFAIRLKSPNRRMGSDYEKADRGELATIGFYCARVTDVAPS